MAPVEADLLDHQRVAWVAPGEALVWLSGDPLTVGHQPAPTVKAPRPWWRRRFTLWDTSGDLWSPVLFCSFQAWTAGSTDFSLCTALLHSFLSRAQEPALAGQAGSFSDSSSGFVASNP